MTDSHRPLDHSATRSPTLKHVPQPGHGSYDGSDPDLPSGHEAAGGRVNVSTVQVGASAAAAVTSALAASAFGVAGTLIGAAVGSIVSTVAGALYADYLKRAGRQLRATKSVVIQRIPSEVLASTPLRHLTGPTDLPGEESLRPVGEETLDETVSVPLAARTDLLASVDESGPASPNGSPTNAARLTGSSSNGLAAAGRPGGTQPAGRPWWKRPLVTLPAVGVAGFLIALGVVTASEEAIGGPISGGSGGTSVTKVFHHTTAAATPSATTQPTATPSTPVTTQSQAPAAATPTAQTTTPAAAPTTTLSTTAPAATTAAAAPTDAAATA